MAEQNTTLVKVESIKIGNLIDLCSDKRLADQPWAEFVSVVNVQRHGDIVDIGFENIGGLYSYKVGDTLAVAPTRICVITEQMANKKLARLMGRLATIVGTEAQEGQTIDGSTELFFDAPTAGLNAMINRLNTVDGVKLAHYRDGEGRMYPNL